MVSNTQIFLTLLPHHCLKVRFYNYLSHLGLELALLAQAIGDRCPFLAAKSVCLSGNIYLTWEWCQSISGPERYLPKAKTRWLILIMLVTILLCMQLNNSSDVWTVFKKYILNFYSKFMLLIVAISLDFSSFMKGSYVDRNLGQFCDSYATSQILIVPFLITQFPFGSVKLNSFYNQAAQIGEMLGNPNTSWGLHIKSSCRNLKYGSYSSKYVYSEIWTLFLPK